MSIKHTNCRAELANIRNGHIFLNDQPIGNESCQLRSNKHRDIRQRRVDAILLDRELQYVVHVLRQISDHDEESPVVTDLCHN